MHICTCLATFIHSTHAFTLHTRTAPLGNICNAFIRCCENYTITGNTSMHMITSCCKIIMNYTARTNPHGNAIFLISRFNSIIYGHTTIQILYCYHTAANLIYYCITSIHTHITNQCALAVSYTFTQDYAPLLRWTYTPLLEACSYIHYTPIANINQHSARPT